MKPQYAFSSLFRSLSFFKVLLRQRTWLLLILFSIGHCLNLYSQENIVYKGIKGVKYADVSYKSGDTLSPYEKERCRLDIFMPDRKVASIPVIVYFHGGGLSSGDKSEGWADWSNNFGYSFLKEGVCMVMVNYRLSGKHGVKWPDYLQDAAAAVAWVSKNIGQYGADKESIFVAGFSAGGYITHMLSIDSRWYNEQHFIPKRIRGYIPMSGQTRQHGTLATDLGVTQAELMMKRPYAMPLALVKKTGKPIFILTGSKEGQTIKDNQSYYEALLKSGSKDVSFFTQEGKDHGGMRDGLGDEDSPSRIRIMEFINKFRK